VLAFGVSAFLFAVPPAALAGDTAAAPAAEGEQAAPNAEGCMPGGGCCGGSNASCPKAQAADDGKGAGGCPCQKAKQAAAEQAAPPAQP
jgi:hypothetical protein